MVGSDAWRSATKRTVSSRNATLYVHCSRGRRPRERGATAVGAPLVLASAGAGVPERRARRVAVLWTDVGEDAVFRNLVLRDRRGVGMVELDQIAGRVADVQLDGSARQLPDAVPEGLVVERTELLHAAVDRHEVRDLEREV